MRKKVALSQRLCFKLAVTLHQMSEQATNARLLLRTVALLLFAASFRLIFGVILFFKFFQTNKFNNKISARVHLEWWLIHHTIHIRKHLSKLWQKNKIGLVWPCKCFLLFIHFFLSFSCYYWSQNRLLFCSFVNWNLYVTYKWGG